MRSVLLAAVLALLRGRHAVPAGRPSRSGTKEIPEWELAFYNRTADLAAATWGTAGGGACLPFTGGCGHLMAMCGMDTDFTKIGACRTYGQNVSEAFHVCKMEALNASAEETSFFMGCLAEHFPSTECSEVCAGVTAGPTRLRCLEECRELGTCFSKCTVEYPWPTAVGDCVSNCMGPVPTFEQLHPGMLIKVIPANPEAHESWQLSNMTLVGNLANMTDAEVAALNALLIESIAQASGVPASSVRIVALTADADAPAAPPGVLLQKAAQPVAPAPVPMMPADAALPVDSYGPSSDSLRQDHVIHVQFEVLAARVDPQQLETRLATAGHALLALVSPPAEAHEEDLTSLAEAAGLAPPTPDQKDHAEQLGTIVSVDVIKGYEVSFQDTEHVWYPAAALVIPETNKTEPCTSIRCGYLKLTHKTLGNTAYHMGDASNAADHMINATAVVSSIVDAFTPAPTGPPPTPFPWDYFRKTLITSSEDPFAAFTPPTPMPSSSVLRIADSTAGWR